MNGVVGFADILARTTVLPTSISPAWLLLAAVFAPAIAGAITLLVPSRVTILKVLVGVCGPIASLVLIGIYLSAYGTELGRVSLPWMTDLHLDFAFNADRLGAFFTLLIAGIGLLILLYGRAYLGNDPADIAKFYPLITLFMTAMLGLCLADDFLLMLLFWELTSVTSFLLIGWDHGKGDAVKKALQAFAVTGFGGLAMLGGLAWLAVDSGVWSFTAMAELPAMNGGVVIAAFVLIYIGIAAKSAQWPMHFWLPGAMAAPTPISAYLHSAAMVKAGIYLLARLWPSFAHLDTWPWVVVGFGSITMVWGVWIALQRDVLKQILAYTTVSQLGLLACVFGLAHFSFQDQTNVIWGNAQILNHAIYKASLFMLAGGLTHALGINALTGLRGAWHAGGERRLYAMLFLLALAALAALPGTFSFFAKEAFLYQVWHGWEETHSPWMMALLVATIFVSMCNIAIFLRFTIIFFDRDIAPLPAMAKSDSETEPHHHGHDDNAFWHAMLWLPAVLLIAMQYAGGLVGPSIADFFAQVEATPFYFDAEQFALWHVLPHPSWPLAFSGIGIAGGMLLGWSSLWRGVRRDPHDAIFPAAYAGIITGGGTVFSSVQSGRLRWYLWATLMSLVALLAFVSVTDGGWGTLIHLPQQAWHDARSEPGGALPNFLSSPSPWLLCGLVILAALILVVIRNRAGRVLVLGATGFSMTGLYYLYAAPDVALTQISVEIVSLILFLLVLSLLPDENPRDRSFVPWRLTAGLAVGVVAGAVTLMACAGDRPERPPLLADGSSPQTLGDYFLRNSYHGVDTAHVDPALVSDGVVDRGEDHLTSFGSKPHHSNDADHPPDDAVILSKGGGGANVVNVILVDFRGFDTLGEITVLALAAMGVWTLLRKPPSKGDSAQTDNRSEPFDDTFVEIETDGAAMPTARLPRGRRAISGDRLASPLLKTIARLLIPLGIVFAMYLFFKGHQSPGGGFVGGLATAVALVVYRMCFGGQALYQLLPVPERVLIGVGLACAVTAAAAPLLWGLPMLTSNNGYLPLPGGGSFHWATVILFDLGVYLIVVGAVVGMIDALARELE